MWHAIYDETTAEVDRVIDERNYTQALLLFNNKGLLGKIEPHFGFMRKGLQELVKRLTSAERAQPYCRPCGRNCQRSRAHEAEALSVFGCPSFVGAGTSRQLLDEPHLDLQLIPHRG